MGLGPNRVVSCNHDFLLLLLTTPIRLVLGFWVSRFPLRMQRYAAAAKKGKIQASPELIKMWGTEHGRFMAASNGQFIFFPCLI